MTLFIKSFGQGKPLVFFHGWGFDHTIWLPIVDELKKNHQIFLIDLPGFGQSEPMTWEEFKYYLLNNLPDKFTLIGWSLGGLFATRLACEIPLRVESLFNITSSPYFTAQNSWPGIKENNLDAFYLNLSINPQKTITQFVNLQLGSISNSEIYTSANVFNMEGLKEGLNILKTWDLREPVKTLSIKVTYLFGRLDAIVPFNTMTAMQVNYPSFNYVLFKKAAHIPFISHRDEFLSLLLFKG